MSDPAGSVDLTVVDPFDLPEWLGEVEVVFDTDTGLECGHLLQGLLSGPAVAETCDLLAVDDAYPAPVVAEADRADAHRAWRHGQVHVVRRVDRLTLAVPGSAFTPELVLEAIARLARAVGADPERYAVLLRPSR